MLAEVADPLEALQLLDDLKAAHPELADALFLVGFDGSQGSVVGTMRTTRIRTLDLNRVLAGGEERLLLDGAGLRDRTVRDKRHTSAPSA